MARRSVGLRSRDTMDPGRQRLQALFGATAATGCFLAVWAFLNAVFNARYPFDEPRFWYLIPSIDVVFLFAYLALFAQSHWRVPKAVRVLLVALFLLVRLVRLGDGVQLRYFAQRFNLYSDLALIPEGVRFSYSTMPGRKFWSLALLVGGGLVGLAVACYRALTYVERYFERRRHVFGFVGVTAVFLGLSFVRHDPRYGDLYLGGFGASAIPRLRYELKFLLNVYGYESQNLKAIADVQERLRRTPSNLSKLGRKNVFLILVESYGATVVERPLFKDRIRPVFDAFESELGQRGFAMASSELDSTTYGGHSWLAHVTLATGVHTENQLQYELIFTQHPKPIAGFFHEAGYRTIIVQPGTTREWPRGELFRFDQHYYSWNFDYAGPSFGWATMPDQYVLDFVRRRELGNHGPPLFVQYVLVSSHAPWSDQPVLLDDWGRIQDGSVYKKLETVHYPIQWPDFTNASEAYIRSIVYDFEVLKRYFVDYIQDDSLFIVMGDHQPVTEVTGYSPSHAVPVHVFSRNAQLLEPFLIRRYTRGMWPRQTEPPRPMELFLTDFLRDFSTSTAEVKVAN